MKISCFAILLQFSISTGVAICGSPAGGLDNDSILECARTALAPMVAADTTSASPDDDLSELCVEAKPLSPANMPLSGNNLFAVQYCGMRPVTHYIVGMANDGSCYCLKGPVCLLSGDCTRRLSEEEEFALFLANFNSTVAAGSSFLPPETDSNQYVAGVLSLFYSDAKLVPQTQMIVEDAAQLECNRSKTNAAKDVVCRKSRLPKRIAREIRPPETSELWDGLVSGRFVLWSDNGWLREVEYLLWNDGRVWIRESTLAGQVGPYHPTQPSALW